MNILIRTLFLLGSVSLGFGQASKEIETSDIPFDHVIAGKLYFPPEAQRIGYSVRIYVYFTITQEGTYKDVATVNTKPVHKSFKQAVIRAWSGLPRETADYAGSYVLPIAFMLSEGEPVKLKPIWNISDGISRERPYKLLKEVVVIGYIKCIKKSF